MTQETGELDALRAANRWLIEQMPDEDQEYFQNILIKHLIDPLAYWNDKRFDKEGYVGQIREWEQRAQEAGVERIAELTRLQAESVAAAQAREAAESDAHVLAVVSGGLDEDTLIYLYRNLDVFSPGMQVLVTAIRELMSAAATAAASQREGG